GRRTPGVDGRPWTIRFTGRYLEGGDAMRAYRVPAGLLLGASTPGNRSILGGRIVLIGGIYAQGRDEELTSAGMMPGVYIWAEALSSWLRHDAPAEPRTVVLLALEFAVGWITGLLLLHFGPALGTLAATGMMLPLSVLSSFL